MSIYKLQKVRHEQGNIFDSNGKPIKFYTGAVNRIACGQNKFGALTGLTKEDEKYFEDALNLPTKTLDRNSDFWAEWNVKVGAGGLLLNDEEPKDALDIRVLKQREHIGSTLQDAGRSGIQYILTSEDHEAKVANDKRTYKVKAFARLATMTPEDQRSYLLATGRNVKGMSPDNIEKLVGDAAELDPKRFLEIELDADKDLKVFTNELLQTGIFLKNGSAWEDTQTGDIIEYSQEGLISFLKDTKNQPYYVSLQKELKKRKAAK